MASNKILDFFSYINEENADVKKNLSRNFYFAPKAENQNKPGASFIQSSKGTLSKAPTGKEISEEEEEEEEGEEKE